PRRPVHDGRVPVLRARAVPAEPARRRVRRARSRGAADRRLQRRPDAVRLPDHPPRRRGVANTEDLQMVMRRRQGGSVPQARTRTRLKVLAALVVFMFAALTTRLWFLQVLASPSFEKQAQENRVRLVPTTP